MDKAFDKIVPLTIISKDEEPTNAPVFKYELKICIDIRDYVTAMYKAAHMMGYNEQTISRFISRKGDIKND